ncbi:MAG: PIN domain-containing protein [Anaerolineae bacterium]|nr:PIN domain-containing protein [Anaerolineae bacterium]
MVGIVDSTVIIHLLRNNPLAMAWVSSISDPVGVTSITWLEVMYGASGKVGQTRAKAILATFDLQFPAQSDQEWAMQQMEHFRLSHGIGINDCLIASVAHRLQVPILTHNQKGFLKILPANLVIKPY